MKKSFLSLLGLLIAFTTLFVSCDNNDIDLNSEISIAASEGGKVAFDDISETSKSVRFGTIVTVVATPDEGYDFVGWFVGDDETAISNEATYTFPAVSDLLLVAKFSEVKNDNDDNVENDNQDDVENDNQDDVENDNQDDAENDNEGDAGNKEEDDFITEYEYVDLGLPSGLMWATYNVGASSPEEVGNYYAWGETEPKDDADYSWSTYKWCYGTEDFMTKYCTKSSYGDVDGKTVLDPEDDAANVNWGGRWRMPTEAEFNELVDKCTWSWTTKNSVNGYKVTGPNGNSIFIPATGCYIGTELYHGGAHGYYWSSTADGRSAYSLLLQDWIYYTMTGGRCDGRCVRAVFK